MCELFYTRTAKLSLWSAVCEEYKLEKLQCCRGKPPEVITAVYLAEYAPLLLLRYLVFQFVLPNILNNLPSSDPQFKPIMLPFTVLRTELKPTGKYPMSTTH